MVLHRDLTLCQKVIKHKIEITQFKTYIKTIAKTSVYKSTLIHLFIYLGLRKTVGAMQKFKEEDLDKKIDYLEKERGLVKEMNLNGQEAVPMMAQTENINR